MPLTKQEARRHYREKSVTHSVDQPGGPPDWQYYSLCLPISSSRADVKSLGSVTGSVGLVLYFKLLAGLFWCFLALTVLKLPVLAAVLSKKRPDAELSDPALFRTTVGAFALPTEAMERHASPGAHVSEVRGVDGSWVPLEAAQSTFAALDALGIVGFAVFVLHFVFVQVPRVARLYDVSNATPSDFTVGVLHCGFFSPALAVDVSFLLSSLSSSLLLSLCLLSFGGHWCVARGSMWCCVRRGSGFGAPPPVPSPSLRKNNVPPAPPQIEVRRPPKRLPGMDYEEEVRNHFEELLDYYHNTESNACCNRKRKVNLGRRGAVALNGRRRTRRRFAEDSKTQ